MRRTLVAAGLGILAIAATALAGAGGGLNVRGLLSGYQEVPVVSSPASGVFEARMAPDGDAIEFELEYADVQADVTQAHIHVGQAGVNGGISVWLCSNLPSPPTPAGFDRKCPTRAGTVTGAITAADVVGPGGQGIAAKELDELRRAIEAGVAYANVHTTQFPGGEARGQLRPGSSGD